MPIMKFKKLIGISHPGDEAPVGAGLPRPSPIYRPADYFVHHHYRPWFSFTNFSNAPQSIDSVDRFLICGGTPNWGLASRATARDRPYYTRLRCPDSFVHMVSP